MKETRQISAFFMKEVDYLRRHFGWRFVWLVYDLMWALSIGFLGSAAGQVAGVELDQSRYIMYLMVGSFMWTYLSSLFSSITWSVVRERWEGTIEYTFMAPVQRVLHLFGQALFAIMWGIVRMVVVFAIATPIFGLSFTTTNFATALLVIAVATVPFIGLGMLISVFPLIDHENGDKVPMFAEAIIMMVSGIYYPIAVMPGWLQLLAKASPATYALEGIRAAMLENLGIIAAWSHLWPLIVSGIIFIPLGLWGFGLAERYAKRTGKLKRDG